MDGAQLAHYYGDQAATVQYALEDLRKVNWFGLESWLRAQATYTRPVLDPELVQRLGAFIQSETVVSSR